MPEPPEIDNAAAVGSVDAHSARLWLRVPHVPPEGLVLELGSGGQEPRRVRFFPLEDPARDFTFSLRYPDDFPGAPPLDPLRRYRFQVRGERDQSLAAGSFETAPAEPEDTPDRFCFGFASCHQPFERDGTVAPRTVGMLEAANAALREHDAKFLLLIGDQMYADSPECLSLHGPDLKGSRLLGLPREEIRRLYQRQYRRFWGAPGFLPLGLERASHCTMDDHEIVDNWGSDDRHALHEWQQIRDGALDAFFDYQAARSWPTGASRPGGLFHSFAYGSIAVFVADVRSERQVIDGQARILAQPQLAALGGFLRDNAHRHALFLVLGVPLVHVPGWLATMGNRMLGQGNDLADRWSSPAFRPQRDQLLDLLVSHAQAHPTQRLVILSGDIHSGWASTLSGVKAPPIFQFVSSALTNHLGSMAGFFARGLLEITQPLGRTVHGVEVQPLPRPKGGKNPYGGMNLGLVEVARQSRDRSSVRFRLIGQDPKCLGRPRVIFDSGPLGKDG